MVSLSLNTLKLPTYKKRSEKQTLFHITATRQLSAFFCFLAAFLPFVFLSQHVWTSDRLLGLWEGGWGTQCVGMHAEHLQPYIGLCSVKEICEIKTDFAKGIQEMAVLHSPSILVAGDFILAGPVSVEVFQAFQISFFFFSPIFQLLFCCFNF